VKQNTKQINRQSIVLTPLLQNKIKLLSLSGQEVRLRIKQELDEHCEEEDKYFSFFKDILKIDSYSKSFRSAINQQNEYFIANKKDLKQNLIEQLYMLNLKDYELLIGEYLIDSIDNNGRLDYEIDFNDICKLVKTDLKKKIEKEDIEKILNKIQVLEPVGCCYRTITESLLIQVKHLDIDIEKREHLNNLLKKIETNLLKIKELKKEDKELIKKLKFNPAQAFVGELGTYIHPDLIVIEKKGIWKTSLNDEFIISSLSERIESSVQNKKEKEGTLSFLKGLERRHQTLVKVGDFIIQKQQAALKKGGDLLPLSIKQISTSLELSESSVSRIVQSKYIQLPDKMIPLSSLLLKKVNVNAKNKKEISSNKLKKMIIQIVESEDKSSPLSDENIKINLKEKFKIEIARRTVTKYRKEANLLTSKQRLIL